VQGASLAIIVDNLVENTPSMIMKDDGFGYTVNIPSVFIGEKDGETIETFMVAEAKRKLDPGSITSFHHSVMVSMNFDV
jgi:hypothetical protein